MENNSIKSRIKIPVIVFAFIVLGHSILGSISYDQFININSLELIIAGIIISVLVSFSFEIITNTLKFILESFKEEVDYEDNVYKIYSYAVKAKQMGFIKLRPNVSEEEPGFLRDALILMCDYTNHDDIKDALVKDIESRRATMYKSYNLLKMIAQVAPAFGLIGTLIGMVGLLSNVEEPSMIMGNMSSALISTLYGALIANFLAIPLMGRVKELIDKKVLEYQIILEGVILIAQNEPTRNIFDKMNFMLPESKRLDYPGTKIRERKNVAYGME